MHKELRHKTIHRCTGDSCDGQATCTWGDIHTLRDGCGDPCSFIMQKSGAGDPPFPSLKFREGYLAAINDLKELIGEDA